MGALAYAPAAATENPARRPPNVLIIGADTLRADHLDLYGYRRPTSPNLDHWAAQAVVFEKAFSQGSYTLPSFASLFTSRYPEEHGALYWGDALAQTETTLAQVFQRAGYQTAGFTGGPYLSPQYGFGRGFDEYVGGDLPRPMSAYAREALKWIDRHRTKPFFLFVQPMDVHDPFDPWDIPQVERNRWDPDYRGTIENYAGSFFFFRALNGESSKTNPPRLTPEMKKEIDDLRSDPRALRHLASMYDDRVAHFDRSLGAFFEELQRRAILNDTIIVLLSDHGTLFGEGGKFAHGVHDSTLDAIFHVALVIWVPGRTPRRVASPVQLVDVAPTLAALAGVPRPGAFEGRDLSALIDGREDSPPLPVFGVASAEQIESGPRRHFIRDGRWKLVLTTPRGRISLYDLTKDPDELRDVSAAHPIETKRLAAALAHHLQRLARDRRASGE